MLMKLNRIILILLICLFLCFFADALYLEHSFFSRQKGKIFSPEVILSAAEKSENTLNNGFHLRFPFYEYAGLFNRLIGRRNTDNMYRLSNGHLVSVGGYSDVSKSVAGVIDLSNFCKENGISFLYVNLPKKYVRNEDLAIFGIEDQTDLKSAHLLGELEAAGIETLDMRDFILARYPDPYDAFFKTDHHWKISAGLYCAQVLSQHLKDQFGLNVVPANISDDRFTVTYMPDSWLGERGRKTGSSYSGLDDFELIKPIAETHFHLEIPKRKLDRSGDFSIMLDEARYTADYWDLRYGPSFYYSYLYANDPIQIIQNEDVDSGKILIIKDSFAQAVNPFLAMTANTLVSWDVRYNRNSLKDYISENQFDIVIVMYNESMINSYQQDRFMFDFS